MADGTQKISKLPPIPTWLIYVIIISVVASWIPLSLIALTRVQTSPRQRVQPIQDMGVQPRYNAQDTSSLFADNRAMRPLVEGTLARGDLRDDDHLYRGYRADDDIEPVTDDTGAYDWFEDLPDQLVVDRDFIERGRERYNINCAVCHGVAGYGDGLADRQVARIREIAMRENRDDPAAGWVSPVNLHTLDAQGLTYGGERYPAGKMFNVISEGIRTMPAYKAQISVEDRWAIVAYVQALQLSQAVDVDEVPQDLGELADPIDPVPAPVEQAPEGEDPLVTQGRQLFQSKICFTCHQTDPNVPPPNPLPGPSFVGGVFGEERNVHVGLGGPIETVEFDEEYFIESVKQPQAKIVEDYGPPRMMPPQPMSDEEVAALMAYVKSLGDDNGEADGEN